MVPGDPVSERLRRLGFSSPDSGPAFLPTPLPLSEPDAYLPLSFCPLPQPRDSISSLQLYDFGVVARPLRTLFSPVKAQNCFVSPMRAPCARISGSRRAHACGETGPSEKQEPLGIHSLVSTRPSTSAEAAQPRGKGPQDYLPPPTATPGLRSVVAQARDRDVRCPTGRGPCSCPPLCSCPWDGRGAERAFSGSRGQGRAAAAAERGSSSNAARPRAGGWGTARRVAGRAHFRARLGPGPHAAAQARKVLAPRGRWDVRSEDAALH